MLSCARVCLPFVGCLRKEIKFEAGSGGAKLFFIAPKNLSSFFLKS